MEGAAESIDESAPIQKIDEKIAELEAITDQKVRDTFYNSWIRETLVQLYDANQGKEPEKGDESSGSGRRSLLAESGRGCLIERPVCRPSKVVSGSAIIAAAAAADDGQRAPVSLAQLKVQDPDGGGAAAEAESVRLCAAALARWQYEKRMAANGGPEYAGAQRQTAPNWQIQQELDCLERIEPFPGASLEELKLLYSMLDYSEDHVHIPESAWREAVAKAGAKYSDGTREELDDLDCAREDPANGLDFRRVLRMPYICLTGC